MNWHAIAGMVSFQWKNPDFLFKNPDLPLKNVDFLSKNDDFVMKQADLPGRCAACQSAEHPNDTDYCKCFEASQGKPAASCAISGKDCTACCEPPPPPPPTPQTDATLRSMRLSVGTLAPAFSPHIDYYTVELGATGAAKKVTLTVAPSRSEATVTISGVKTSTLTQLLEKGVNQTVPVVVTAEDGVTTQAYVIAIDD